MLLARYFLADYAETKITSDFTDWAKLPKVEGACRTTEWLRGEKLCTYKGKYHLAWSVPMYDVSYWSPSAAIHSFLVSRQRALRPLTVPPSRTDVCAVFRFEAQYGHSRFATCHRRRRR